MSVARERWLCALVAVWTSGTGCSRQDPCVEPCEKYFQCMYGRTTATGCVSAIGDNTICNKFTGDCKTCIEAATCVRETGLPDWSCFDVDAGQYTRFGRGTCADAGACADAGEVCQDGTSSKRYFTPDCTAVCGSIP